MVRIVFFHEEDGLVGRRLCSLKRIRMKKKILTGRIPSNSNIPGVTAKIANIFMCPLQRQPLVPEAIIPKGFTSSFCLFFQLLTRKETEHVEAVRWTHYNALAGCLAE